MSQKSKWTREDYARMIGLSGASKKKLKKKKGIYIKGGARIEGLMLAKLIGQKNRNKSQRKALISTMNNTQLKGVGRILRSFMNSKYKLSPRTLN